MRHLYVAMLGAAVLLAGGVAQAAPGFGASSHQLGGSVGASGSDESKSITFLESVLGLIGIEFAVSVEPVVGDRFNEPASRSKECKDAEKAEVAKADAKPESGAGAAKNPVRPHEPVYLAF